MGLPQVTLSKLIDADEVKTVLTRSTYNRFVFRDRSGNGYHIQVLDSNSLYTIAPCRLRTS